MNRISFHSLAVLVAATIVGGAPTIKAQPPKKVACTLTTIEALVREIGGDRVQAFSLSAGDQDPHAVSPTPSLMKRVREADVLLQIGMQLELWADDVANGSGNSRIFRGAAGRIALATGIPKLDVPSEITRAQGDVHPEGNPHLWLDPMRAKLMAENIAGALKALSPQDAAFFDARLRTFQRRVDEVFFGKEMLRLVGSAKLTRLTLGGRLHDFLETNDYAGKKLTDLAGGWLARAKPLRGQNVIEFHKVWGYFAAAFGFRLVGTIEEKPGIAPGPRHVNDTVALMKRDLVKVVVVDNFYDPALPRRIARDGGARVAVLANQVRGDKGIDDYFSLIDRALDGMLIALRPSVAGVGP